MMHAIMNGIRPAIVSAAMTAGVDIALQRMSKERYDARRTVRTSSFAFASTYPQLAYFRAIHRACSNSVQKTLMNQFVFAPLNISAGISWNLLLQNEHRKIPSTIRKNILPGLAEGAAYWIPLNLVVFSCVPYHHHFMTFKLLGIPAKFLFVSRTTKK